MNRQNIVLIGMPGCGKSTVGRHVSSQTGLQFVDLDRYIEDLPARQFLSCLNRESLSFVLRKRQLVKIFPSRAAA